MAALSTEFEHKELIYPIAYIAMLVITFIFIFASVVLLATYLSSFGMVVTCIEWHPQRNKTATLPSLTDDLTSMVQHISVFFEMGIKSGRDLTNGAITNFVGNSKVSCVKNLFSHQGLWPYQIVLVS